MLTDIAQELGAIMQRAIVHRLDGARGCPHHATDPIKQLVKHRVPHGQADRRHQKPVMDQMEAVAPLRDRAPRLRRASHSDLGLLRASPDALVDIFGVLFGTRFSTILGMRKLR